MSMCDCMKCVSCGDNACEKLAIAKEALEEIANAGGFNSGADAETAREALEKLR